MRPDAFLEFFFTASMFSVVVMSGSVYPGSEFVKEALERATELTDAAYARASDRYTWLDHCGHIPHPLQSIHHHVTCVQLCFYETLTMFPGRRSLCPKALWDPVTCWLSSNRLKPGPGLRSWLQNCWTTPWSWSERWCTRTQWCSPTPGVRSSNSTQHRRCFSTFVATSTTTSTNLTLLWLSGCVGYK